MLLDPCRTDSAYTCGLPIEFVDALCLGLNLSFYPIWEGDEEESMNVFCEKHGMATAAWLTPNKAGGVEMNAACQSAIWCRVGQNGLVPVVPFLPLLGGQFMRIFEERKILSRARDLYTFLPMLGELLANEHDRALAWFHGLLLVMHYDHIQETNFYAHCVTFLFQEVESCFSPMCRITAGYLAAFEQGIRENSAKMNFEIWLVKYHAEFEGYLAGMIQKSIQAA